MADLLQQHLELAWARRIRDAEAQFLVFLGMYIVASCFAKPHGPNGVGQKNTAAPDPIPLGLCALCLVFPRFKNLGLLV